MRVVLAGAAAIIVGTWLGLPTLSPIVAGLVIGLGWPQRAARFSALAGVVAWGGLLLAAALRGDAVGTLAATLGAAMGLPGWALPIATLAYPATLGASAGWLAHLRSPVRGTSRDAGALFARASSHS
jgi:hypothetical protein